MITIETFSCLLRCRCGAEERISVGYSIDAADLDGTADQEAELLGWGDRDTCPECQSKLDKDIAEVNAADAERMELSLGLR